MASLEISEKHNLSADLRKNTLKLKLLVAGSEDVGKKALVQQFVKHDAVNVDGYLVDIQIFANLGEFASYLQTCSPDDTEFAIMFVYDASEPQTFWDITEIFELEIYQHKIGMDATKVLLCNKIDLDHYVPDNVAEEFAEKHGMMYFKASAMDNIAVHEVFKAVIMGAICKSYMFSLFEEAMQSGYVVCNLITLLLIGVAGSGKTCFSQFVLDQPPPVIRESTPIANASIRAVSTSRATVLEVGAVWKTVSPTELLSMVGDKIRSRLILHFQTTSLGNSLPLNSPSIVGGGVFKKLLRKLKKLNIPVEKGSSPLGTPDNLLISQYKPTPEKVTKLTAVQNIMSQMSSPPSEAKEVFNEDWIYLTDSGGQPQFHELIPTFIHHVSGVALFVKLNEDLSSHPTIGYYAKGGKLCGTTYTSSLTHEQTIKNCLQTMQSRLNITGGNDCPALFFVGTHRDLASSSSQSIEEKDKHLLSMLKLQKNIKEHLVYNRVAKPKRLMYVVNPRNPDDEDRQTVAAFRKAVMKTCKTVKLKIPLSWFILERQLQELAEKKCRLVLSFEECLEAACDLGMDRPRLLAALNYFVSLNLFKFFPEVLPNVVFTTSQVLLDKISELVAYSHYLNGGDSVPDQSKDDASSLRFSEHGIVNTAFLEIFESHYQYSNNLFTPQDLLKVLSNQLVFAPLTGGDYFMPCVLPHLALEKIFAYRLPSSSPIAPLLIYYPGSLFPTGFFSALIAFLHERTPWTVAEEYGEPICLYKNCVIFRHIDYPINLALIYSFEFIEIHMKVHEEFNLKPFTSVRTTLLLALERAAMIQGCSKTLKPQLGFLCLCGKESSQHLATVSRNGKWWFCSIKNTHSGPLNERHLIWLSDFSEEPSSTTPTATVLKQTAKESPPTPTEASSEHRDQDPYRITPSEKPTLKQLLVLTSRDGKRLRVMDTAAPEWEDLAIALGFEAADIECVKRDYIQNAKGACREILTKWLNGEIDGNEQSPAISWNTLVQSLIDAGQVGLAEELQEMLHSYIRP